jgi:hypothetical protein
MILRTTANALLGSRHPGRRDGRTAGDGPHDHGRIPGGGRGRGESGPVRDSPAPS